MHALIKMYVYVCFYVYSLLTNYLYNLYKYKKLNVS